MHAVRKVEPLAEALFDMDADEVEAANAGEPVQDESLSNVRAWAPVDQPGKQVADSESPRFHAAGGGDQVQSGC